MSSKLQSPSQLLKVPRAQEFARARYEALEKQLADKLEKKQAERRIKINEQKSLIEEAFDQTPVSMEYVKVILPGFKTLFDEEIETELHNHGYCVDYSVQDDAPAQTTAWIYPEITEADYETIHNEVYRLETEIRGLIEDALRVQTPEPAPRTLPNLDVIRQLVMQLQKYDDDSDEFDESECDCGCDHEEDSEDDSEDESEDDSEDESDDDSEEEHICDDCYEEFYGKSEDESEEPLSTDTHVELCHDCCEELCSDLCNDCGLPRAPTPDLCDDCGKPQLQ